MLAWCRCLGLCGGCPGPVPDAGALGALGEPVAQAGTERVSAQLCLRELHLPPAAGQNLVSSD